MRSRTAPWHQHVAFGYMHLTIKPNARLDQSTFDSCGDWEEAEDERLLVDLTDCIFVDVYAMAVLLTIVSMWCLQGDPVEIRLPVAKGTRSYWLGCTSSSSCHPRLPVARHCPS